MELKTSLGVIGFGESDQAGVVVISSINMDPVELHNPILYLSVFGEVLFYLLLVEPVDVLDIDVVVLVPGVRLDLDELALDLEGALAEDFGRYFRLMDTFFLGVELYECVDAVTIGAVPSVEDLDLDVSVLRGQGLLNHGLHLLEIGGAVEGEVVEVDGVIGSEVTRLLLHTNYFNLLLAPFIYTANFWLAQLCFHSALFKFVSHDSQPRTRIQPAL